MFVISFLLICHHRKVIPVEEPPPNFASMGKTLVPGDCVGAEMCLVPKCFAARTVVVS